MHGRFARLMGRDEPMFQERGPSISVRINVSLAPYSFAVPHTCHCIGPDGVQISGRVTKRGVARYPPGISATLLVLSHARNLQRTWPSPSPASLQ